MFVGNQILLALGDVILRVTNNLNGTKHMEIKEEKQKYMFVGM
jgi:hypothetical protein